MTLREMVRALRDVTKAEAAAVINRDGAILSAELPPSVSPETFSIMCAAILGAGMTASTELRHKPPRRVVLESVDATTLIQEVGRRSMVVLVLPPKVPLDRLDGVLRRFSESAASELP
jgi:predicted regulator of Ras-like GTPase activity (Roadblock/LC7/MglB family)